ncbi:MAG TPA: hypothetical protein VH575_11525 [Gemmataceae bacterium]|jgi:DNA-binding transcriptional ArsR family regulator
MTAGEPSPEQIIQFLEANIASVEQLEILRLLSANRGREWRAAVLARQVQSPPQVVAQHLIALEARGLLTLHRGGELACRHGSRTPQLAQMLNHLLQFYNERPVSTIRLIYSRLSADARGRLPKSH